MLHRSQKSGAWELSADKSGKRVFWVTYGQIFKDETREECATVEEKENIAQPQKKVTHTVLHRLKATFLT